MKELKTWQIWIHFWGYFICFILGGLFAAIPRFIIGFENESSLLLLTSEVLRIPITVGVLYLYTKYVVKLPINKSTLSTKNLKTGKWVLVGISLPILTLAIFYLTGNLTLTDYNSQLSQSTIIDHILRALGMSMAAGVVEEVVFRGYLFNLLKSKYKLWVAAVVPSLIFTLIHLGGADSVFNAIQLLIAGMMVSIMFLMIYLYTKSIWNASIVHFIWNFLILNKLIVFSDTSSDDYLFQLGLGNNSIFNGGAFGLEVSIPAIIIYGILIIILWKLIDKKKTTYNKDNQ